VWRPQAAPSGRPSAPVRRGRTAGKGARAGGAPIDVLVVVPALNSRPRHWLSDIDDAVARAHARLAVALAGLRTRGVEARGEVGDANPLVASRTFRLRRS